MEKGNHKELVELGGKYSKFCMYQENFVPENAQDARPNKNRIAKKKKYGNNNSAKLANVAIEILPSGP